MVTMMLAPFAPSPAMATGSAVMTPLLTDGFGDSLTNSSPVTLLHDPTVPHRLRLAHLERERSEARENGADLSSSHMT